MSFAYPLTGLVTILALIVYFYMSTRVGGARSKHNVPAPTMTGPDELMRVIRVHENTMEGLILFLPSLWLFALTTHDMWAAVVGIFYPIGRVLYAQGYYQAANKRGTGFIIGLGSTALLLVGSAVAIINSVITFGI
ncbi:MAG: MAPEG family protein [Parvibaculum sp.]|nr:MAPEG family protein [Parvibaculum sp.]|tara:strand:- start:7076 stop:7483 length:408 start_codon:yes stop_codon:yes gene_type:complete